MENQRSAQEIAGYDIAPGMYAAYYNMDMVPYIFDLKKIPRVTRRIAKDSNKSSSGWPAHAASW